MLCPSCQKVSSKVVDSRAAKDGAAIRRRRECISCGFRYTTFEYIEQRQLQVLKRDGSAEPFKRDKLRTGILTACAKRPVSTIRIETVVDAIEEAVYGSAGVEVSSDEIGELVMKALKPLDRVAYIRYASVYRNFEAITEFQEMVEELSAREIREAQARTQTELQLPFEGEGKDDGEGA